MPMLGTARRLNERFAPVVFLLLSAAPLFAQEAERTNNANGLVGLIAVLFIAVGFYVMHRMRKRIAQERGSSKRDNPIQWLMRKAFTNISSAVSPNEPLKSKPTPPPPADKAAKSIFISYRRQDSQHIAGRIYDKLAGRFGPCDEWMFEVNFRQGGWS
jgi:hypothetical protein